MSIRLDVALLALSRNSSQFAAAPSATVPTVARIPGKPPTAASKPEPTERIIVPVRASAVCAVAALSVAVFRPAAVAVAARSARSRACVASATSRSACARPRSVSASDAV
ncbi:hypothetical protein X947_6084 [Burkholderia pseudomallei MSHR7334]|nr:hypothetical protein X947_6084 [Burkholderia pseudomallei MSHR7334]